MKTSIIVLDDSCSLLSHSYSTESIEQLAARASNVVFEKRRRGRKDVGELGDIIRITIDFL